MGGIAGSSDELRCGDEVLALIEPVDRRSTTLAIVRAVPIVEVQLFV